MGFSVDGPVQQAVQTVPEDNWHAAHDADRQPRDGSWVVEITDQLDL